MRYDNRDGSTTAREENDFFPGEGNPMLTKTPPRLVHGFKAISGEAAYLFDIPMELYKYDAPDEYGLPYDSPGVP